MTVDPDPVDVHVGQRLRLRRKDLGFSQQDVAHALGLTFQQVQKYESGANRISASKLHATSLFLQAPITFFFDGLASPRLDKDADAALNQEITTFWSTPGGRDIAKAYPRINSNARRRVVGDLVKALAEAD